MEEPREQNSLDQCIHGAAPPCSRACPFGFDVHAFIEKMQRGSMSAAFRLYRNAVVFPGIVWRLCTQPCAAACVMAPSKEAVSMALLERACTEHARSTAPPVYNLQKKEHRIAVVGTGLAGLTCAYKFASNKYDVVIYERGNALGGSLKDVLAPEEYLPEIEELFRHEQYELHLNTEIKALDELDCDAVYLSSGVDIGLDPTKEADKDKVFRCPSGLTHLEEIAHGIASLHEIEWYLKTGARRVDEGEVVGELCDDGQRVDGRLDGCRADGWSVDGRVGARADGLVSGRADDLASSRAGSRLNDYPESHPAARAKGYTKEEAVEEAARCLLCDCTECMRCCSLLQHYQTYPPKLKDAVGITLNPTPLQTGRVGLRQISSCNLCGLCERVCPVDVAMGDYLLKTRQELFTTGALPAAYHEYWLRDMAFSNSDEASLVLAPSAPPVRYAFFPGCQLGGSDPRYVTETYAYLESRLPGTALLLRCCGAPALWAGDAALFEAEIQALLAKWEGLGRPELLMACPSCLKLIKEYAPAIPARMVYEVMLEAGAPDREGNGKDALRQAAVFDPCSSGGLPKLQEDIRELARARGVALEELQFGRDEAQCCGWGGQVYSANPAYADEIAEKRISQSALPYITYCTNCRDIFATAGKACVHILDLLFGLNDTERSAPTVSKRRENRRFLRRVLVEQYGQRGLSGQDDRLDQDGQPGQLGQGIPQAEEVRLMELIMDDALIQRASRDLILDEDICAVISHCEKTGYKLLNADSGRFVGHLQRGYITYWVEYTPQGDAYRVHSAYCHRMTMQEQT
jgi:NADPH-dependent glutamate synthase beta subunit-like oxidoreductase